MSDERWVFIVRVWHEQDKQLATPVLRGSVQPLGAANPRYFDSLETLIKLIQAALALSPTKPSNPPHPPKE